MKRKRLFSIAIAVVLVFAFSVAVFAVAENLYNPTPLTNQNEGYFTVFDVKATENAGKYKATDMTARITFENITLPRTTTAGRWLAEGTGTITLQPSEITGNVAYTTSAALAAATTMPGDAYGSGTDQLQGLGANDRGFWYDFTHALSAAQKDTANNLYIEDTFTFDNITAEPGDKFPVVLGAWNSPVNGNISFCYYSTDGTINATVDDLFVINGNLNEIGHIFIPLKAQFMLGNAVQDVQTWYADEKKTLPTDFSAFKQTKAVAVGWTLTNTTNTAGTGNIVYATRAAAPTMITEYSTYKNDGYTGGNVQLYPVFLKDENDDDIPDDDQFDVTYTIVNGTWDDTKFSVNNQLTLNGDKTVLTEKVTKDANTGKAKFAYVPETADPATLWVKPNANYTNIGAWTPAPAPVNGEEVGAVTAYFFTLIPDNGPGPDPSGNLHFIDLETNQEFTPDNWDKPIGKGTKVYAGTDKYIVDSVLPNVPKANDATINCYKSNDGDDIPDVYQVTATYKIVGGVWKTPTGSDPRVAEVRLTKVDSNGEYAINGTAELTGGKIYDETEANVDMYHDATDFNWDSDNSACPDPTVANAAIGKDSTFTLIFKEIATYKFFDVTDPANKVRLNIPTNEAKDPYVKKAIKDVNGDTYIVVAMATVKDADGDYAVDCLPSENGVTPDKYIKKVTLKIENGTWDGTDSAEINEDVELLNNAGEWDANGKGTIKNFPDESKFTPDDSNYTVKGWVDSADNAVTGLPEVTGNNAETFTFKYVAPSIIPVDPNGQDIGDIIKIMRWTNSTPDVTGESANPIFKNTYEMFLKYNGQTIATDGPIRQMMNSVSTWWYNDYDGENAAFGSNSSASDFVDARVNTQGKLTFTAKKPGITKVNMKYNGSTFELVIVIPGDADGNGTFNIVDWMTISDYFKGKLAAVPEYKVSLNGGAEKDLFLLTIDMDSDNINPAPADIKSSDWFICRSLYKKDFGF